MCTKNELDNILQMVATDLQKSFGSTLDKVILYGSYARGDNDQDSDIDIMVLLNVGQPQDYEYRTILSRISSDIGLSTDQVVSFAIGNTQDFDEKKSWHPFFKNIEADGRKIYERV